MIGALYNTPVWEAGNWSPLPPIAGDHVADVCVVGLGGSGLACIGELITQGRRVIGIDQGRVGGGAAGRNGGFLLAGLADFYHQVVARYGRETSRTLYQQTLAEIRRMADETPDLVRLVGSLRIAGSDEEEADCRAQMAAMRADGLPVAWYEGPAGRGLVIPSDGTFMPLARCRKLAQQAIAAGSVLCEATPALTIRPGVVQTSHARITCSAIVVAVDGGLERVVPELAGRVQTRRLQMLATAPMGDLPVALPVYRRWGYDYWQQLPDGRVALGGGRDLDCDQHGPAEPSDSVQAYLERILRTEAGCEAPITHRWAAHVAYTTTGLPVCEMLQPGLWVMGGYNGTGNVIGALCGRSVAQRIAQGSTALWMA